MKVVSVYNYKGGVGKTTLTANLGAYAASIRKRVLLIDLDPQCNLTFSFIAPELWDREFAERQTLFSFFNAIHEKRVIPDLSSLVYKCNIGHGRHLDLISSHLQLINVDVKLSAQLIGNDAVSLAVNKLEAVSYLREALSCIKDFYDLVLIDCPPNFYLIVKNALTASDFFLVPTKLDYFSTLGTDYVIKNVNTYVNKFNENVRLLNNPKYKPIYVDLLGIVPMMVSVPREDTLQKPLKYYYDWLRERHYMLFQWIRNNNAMFGTETVDKEGNKVPAVLAHMKPDVAKLKARAELQELCNDILSRLQIM